MYAGFWVRFVAYVIDSLIVGVLLLVVRIPLGLVLGVLPNAVSGTEILFSYTLSDVILYVVRAAYFIVLTYHTGRTLGKRIMRLQVVSQGAMPSLKNIVYRETVGRFLCGFFFCAGYVVAGFDREKRGIHDMLSDTRVIYERTCR